MTDVGETGNGLPIDRVVSLRYPSYAVRHPRHVCWLNHRMREYYDLWEEFSSGLGTRGRLVEGVRRRTIHFLDGRLLRRRTLMAQSKTIQSRLSRWGGLSSRVLYPPAPQRPYRCDEYDGSILVVGRLTKLKRVDLLLRAAAAAGGEWRVRIAGEGPERQALMDLTRELDLENRVVLLGEFVEVPRRVLLAHVHHIESTDREQGGHQVLPDVVLAEHDPFREASGAGGVEEPAGVAIVDVGLRGRRLVTCVDQRLVAFAQIHAQRFARFANDRRPVAFGDDARGLVDEISASPADEDDGPLRPVVHKVVNQFLDYARPVAVEHGKIELRAWLSHLGNMVNAAGLSWAELPRLTDIDRPEDLPVWNCVSSNA